MSAPSAHSQRMQAEHGEHGEEQKQLFEQMAALYGPMYDAFTTLSARDQRALLEAMLYPAPAGPVLRRTAARSLTSSDQQRPVRLAQHNHFRHGKLSYNTIAAIVSALRHVGYDLLLLGIRIFRLIAPKSK